MRIYEEDYEKFGTHPLSGFETRSHIQDLSNQVNLLSSLEFDEEKRNALLGLPEEIENKSKEVKRREWMR